MTAAQDEPKARVTLNLPASMYREVERWSVEAADSLGVPRVGIQDAMRAMLTACILDKSIGLVVLDLLRRGHEDDQVSTGHSQRSTAS